jgi:transposase
MSEKRYIVRLSEQERADLSGVVNTEERVAKRKRRRAQILMKVDAGEHGPAWTDERAAEAFDVHVVSVQKMRQQLVEQGFEAALNRKRQDPPPRTPVFDEGKERTLIALAQGEPPVGRARWTLHLLADELVRLDVVDAVSHETVRKALKKTRSIPTGRSLG